MNQLVLPPNRFNRMPLCYAFYLLGKHYELITVVINDYKETKIIFVMTILVFGMGQKGCFLNHNGALQFKSLICELCKVIKIGYSSF